ELFLLGCHITPLPEASTHVQPDPTRTRKLLMHAQQIDKLVGKVERAGYTLVPLDLHYTRGRIKLEIGLAKGKRQYDKRAAERELVCAREKERLRQPVARRWAPAAPPRPSRSGSLPRGLEAPRDRRQARRPALGGGRLLEQAGEQRRGGEGIARRIVPAPGRDAEMREPLVQGVRGELRQQGRREVRDVEPGIGEADAVGAHRPGKYLPVEGRMERRERTVPDVAHEALAGHRRIDG